MTTELAFTRRPDDRRSYALEGFGVLRLGPWWKREATAEAPDGRAWELRRSGWGRRAVMADASGEAATFEPQGGMRRGGRLALRDGTVYDLRPSSAWRERYALADGDVELATFEASGWGGRRPVRVTVAGGRTPDALVVLAAGWLVKTFGEDLAATAGATTAATSSAVSG